MKKLLRIAVLAVCGVSAASVAAQQPVIKAGASSVDVCPLNYADGGGKVSSLLSIIDGEQARIYNPALQEVREFALKGHPMRIRAKVGDAEYMFRFTQSMFNDDDKFEYLVAAENSRKVEIINEDGAKIGEFDFGNCVLDNDEVDFLFLSYDDSYLLFDVYDPNASSMQSWIYSLNQATGAVQKVAENVMGLSVRPTVTDGSVPVEITLGKVADANLAVAVVAANGSQAMTDTINAGESGISLNVGHLAKGVYVVNVGGCEHAKFIIR